MHSQVERPSPVAAPNIRIGSRRQEFSDVLNRAGFYGTEETACVRRWILRREANGRFPIRKENYNRRND